MIALARKFDSRKGRRPRTPMTPAPVFANKSDVEAAARLYDERLARASAYARARRRSGRGRQNASWTAAHADTSLAQNAHQPSTSNLHPLNTTAAHTSSQYVTHHPDSQAFSCATQTHPLPNHLQPLGAHNQPITMHSHQAVALARHVVLHDQRSFAHVHSQHMHTTTIMMSLAQQNLTPMIDVNVHSHLVQNDAQEVGAQTGSSRAAAHANTIHRADLQGTLPPHEVEDRFVQVSMDPSGASTGHGEDMHVDVMQSVANGVQPQSLPQNQIVGPSDSATRTIDVIGQTVTAEPSCGDTAYHNEVGTQVGQVEGFQPAVYQPEGEGYQQAHSYQHEGDSFQQEAGVYPDNRTYDQGAQSNQHVEGYQCNIGTLPQEAVKQEQVESYQHTENVQHHVGNVYDQNVVRASEQQDDVAYQEDGINKKVNGVQENTEASDGQVGEGSVHEAENSTQILSDNAALGHQIQEANEHNLTAKEELGDVQHANVILNAAEGTELAAQNLEVHDVMGTNSRGIDSVNGWNNKGKGTSNGINTAANETNMRVARENDMDSENGAAEEAGAEANREVKASDKSADVNGVATLRTDVDVEGKASANESVSFVPGSLTSDIQSADVRDSLCIDGNVLNCGPVSANGEIIFDGEIRVDEERVALSAAKRNIAQVVGMQDVQDAGGAMRKKAKCAPL